MGWFIIAELSDPEYWINPEQSSFNVTINDPTQYIIDHCTLFNGAIYQSFSFMMTMLVLNSVCMLLSRKLPKFGVITIKKKIFPFALKLKQTHPRWYLALSRLGLDGIDARKDNVFRILGNVFELAMIFRLIQVYLNLKFKYGVI